MESPLLRLKREKGPNLYILQRTRTIQQEDIDCSWQWEEINKWYNATQEHPDCEWVDRATQSIVNSMVHQRRLCFALGFHLTRKLLRGDKNWEKIHGKTIGMGSKYYNLLRQKLVEAGIIELVREGKGQQLSIYKVVNEDIKKMIVVDEMDQQIAEVIDFVDQDKGKSEGKAKEESKEVLESKKESKVEGKTIEPNNTCLVEKSSGDISFEELLFKYHADDWPKPPDISPLARLAIKYCPDFDADNYHMSILKKHLKGKYKSLTPPQKDGIEKIATAFEYEAKRHLALLKTEDMTLEEPDELISQAIRQDIDDEAKGQSYTIEVMLGSAVGDNIRVLKRSLEKADNEQEKFELEQEIKYWEQMNGQ